jgi:hypothetical protein
MNKKGETWVMHPSLVVFIERTRENFSFDLVRKCGGGSKKTTKRRVVSSSKDHR